MEPSRPVKRPTRAPTLYVIIAIKLLKGLVLLLVGLGVMVLVGQNLDQRFDDVLRWIHFDPEKKFFAELGEKLQKVTPAKVRGVAIGTMLYSVFSLTEGIGLIFRVRWIGWVVIGESLFFIPIEVYDLLGGFSTVVFVILLINIFIVWYLLKNKERLFKHH
ncbi:MAG TPA: DUF2127 domain-containing protein [Verrucomicrobiae bacterium]|jgi:uncharacterized membrane protein (DUF2068 family)